MPRRSGTIRIGISGWRYVPWRGTFYPESLSQKRELEFASRHFNSIEINGTFYSLQSPASFRNWHEQTPDGFVFSAKGGRYLTHMLRLRNLKVPLANFFASGILLLGEKLGPILWQFPPNFSLDLDRFEEFFDLLPTTTEAAADLAKRHHEKLRLGTWTKTDALRPLRHAVEVRHESFANPAFVALLRKYNVALVVADTAGKWPLIEDITADFSYLRLHGEEELYASGYTDAALNHWAAKIDAWRRGSDPPDAQRIAPVSRKRPAPRDVFVYFDNDVKVRAPFDAMSLSRKLQLPVPPAFDVGAGVSKSAESPRQSWPSAGRRRVAKRKS
jgi:uncharacterized protein YecE (DUF72 family)